MKARFVRSEAEIQRAHDVLHFLGTPEAPAIFSDPTVVHAVHDALAWVLGYPCGDAFADNVEAIHRELRKLGYVEIDTGKPARVG